MPPKKVLGEKRLTAEEKKRKEEKEQREKDKERKERKAQLAADRTFGLKNKNVSAKVAAKVDDLKRDAPTKEAEEAAKRELEILMGVRSAIPERRKVAAEGEDALAGELESMVVTAEPKNFVRKTVETQNEATEPTKELTEEERREIIAKIELEKARVKEAELKAKVDVNPFHVDDEGWYDSDEDPFELLKMVAGNKRAIIMPKGYEDPDEDAMET